MRLVLLNSQEVQQREVSLLIEAQNALPVGGILALLVQSIESEERGVKTGQQDWQQEGRAGKYSAVGQGTQWLVHSQHNSSNRSTALRGLLVLITMVLVPRAGFGHPPRWLLPLGWHRVLGRHPPPLVALGTRTCRATT